MYIETSPPIKPGMKAQLASTLLPRIDKNMCLEFWYNMYGKTVGSLKVILLGKYRLFTQVDLFIHL